MVEALQERNYGREGRREVERQQFAVLEKTVWPILCQYLKLAKSLALIHRQGIRKGEGRFLPHLKNLQTAAGKAHVCLSSQECILLLTSLRLYYAYYHIVII